MVRNELSRLASHYSHVITFCPFSLSLLISFAYIFIPIIFFSFHGVDSRWLERRMCGKGNILIFIFNQSFFFFNWIHLFFADWNLRTRSSSWMFCLRRNYDHHRIFLCWWYFTTRTMHGLCDSYLINTNSKRFNSNKNFIMQTLKKYIFH